MNDAVQLTIKSKSHLTALLNCLSSIGYNRVLGDVGTSKFILVRRKTKVVELCSCGQVVQSVTLDELIEADNTIFEPINVGNIAVVRPDRVTIIGNQTDVFLDFEDIKSIHAAVLTMEEKAKIML